MENKEIWAELLTYIAQHHELSSPFAYPRSIPTIEVFELLNKIADLRGITHIENGEEYNRILENRN